MKKNPVIDRSLLVRAGPLGSGRNPLVSPRNSCMNYLSYGRILLDRNVSEVEINTEEQEFNLIVLRGNVTVSADGESSDLEPYDSVYVPRDSRVRLTVAQGNADLVECSAPVSQASGAQVVRFKELEGRHPLHMKVGQEGYIREVFQFVGPQVKAFRLLTGMTFGKPGNWTSFPPHKHETTREEIYVFVNMPQPGFGVQFIYEDPEHIEFAELVRENDVVLLPKGYHPNVGAPGFGMNFVWMMAAYREVQDREWADMEWQPDLREYYQ